MDIQKERSFNACLSRVIQMRVRAVLLSVGALLCCCPLPSAFAQQRVASSITFIATDQDGSRLPFASLFVESIDRRFAFDDKGVLVLNRRLLQGKETRVTVSYIGKVAQTQRLTETQLRTLSTVTFTLKEDNMYIKEVQVNAVREARQSNSSVLIQRQTIDNIQAYSLADVMQTLPGKAISNADMHNAAFLTLRSATTGGIENPLDVYSRNKINDFTRNAAFGIAYVLDGTPLSNNTNMQLDSYGKWGGIKMFDRRFNTDNNENVANGQDLRFIPASSIESIEVISGVAPVKYGDLSNGAVIINRRAGLTPFYGSVKVQYDIVSASLGKGFSLGERGGLLHFNADYRYSTKDKRDDLKTNANVALNATWSKQLSRRLSWDNTLSLDLSQSIDGLKSDPDAVLNRTKTERSSFRLATRGTLSPKWLWADVVDYNLSLSVSRQYDMHEEYITNRDRRIITDDYTSGLHETDIAPPYYVSKLEIEGIPLQFYGNVELNKYLKRGRQSHNLSVGVFGSYEANVGRGKIFDPQHPFHDGGVGGRGDRSYDYKNRIKLLQYGGYVQNKMKTFLGEHLLTLTGGLRLEVQRARFAVSPRVNGLLLLSNGWSCNAAYGISYKIPATAYLYPENVYFDRLVFSHYSDNHNERLYLYQTKVIDPTNPHLKSPYTHSMELGVAHRRKAFSTSLTAYMKIDLRGISSKMMLDTMYVQNYKLVGQTPTGRPLYEPAGDLQLITDAYYKPENTLYSRNLGLELVGNIDDIRPLGVSLNYSVVYNQSFYHAKGERMAGSVDMEQEAVVGLYAPLKNRSEEIVSTLSITKQMPKIGLIFNLRLQNFWYRHYHRYGFNIYPVGYYNKNFEVVRFSDAEAQNPKWAYLWLTDSEPVNIKQPIIVPNCHFRVSKEIGRKLRLSCYINNVFNHRPYIERSGKRIYFNQSPTISMDVSYKF